MYKLNKRDKVNKTGFTRDVEGRRKCSMKNQQWNQQNRKFYNNILEISFTAPNGSSNSPKHQLLKNKNVNTKTQNVLIQSSTNKSVKQTKKKLKTNFVQFNCLA
jgi:hypothetical protein